MGSLYRRKTLTSNMKTINSDELKKIQLGILEFTADFCNANNISYWINAGTMLGAIRHKGFIPWDDDIDIGMLRSDYDKFVRLFNTNSSNRYRFHCFENDTKYMLHIGKVYDESTILYEPDKKNGRKMSVNIDVFVYDNIPNSPEAMKLYKIRDFYKRIWRLQKAKDHKGSKIRQKLVGCIGTVLRIIPTRWVVDRIVNNGYKYRNIHTGFVGDYVGAHDVIIPLELLNNFINVEFEGKEYRVPAEYDKWLRLFYGNYMELPPVDKQVSYHRFEAYYREGK